MDVPLEFFYIDGSSPRLVYNGKSRDVHVLYPQCYKLKIRETHLKFSVVLRPSKKT